MKEPVRHVWCRDCEKQFHYQLDAHYTQLPYDEKQRILMRHLKEDGVTCSTCMGTNTEPFQVRLHGSKRQKGSWWSLKQQQIRRLPRPKKVLTVVNVTCVTCPRCNEEVVALPTHQTTCPHCFGY